VKFMTCRELGGPCEQKLSADTWDEMVKTMSRHVMEKHLDTAEAMKRMRYADPKKWGREMKPKWEAKPEASQAR
jgi:predicted small metal-binding protein